MSLRRIQKALAIGAVVAMAVLAGACGGGSDDDTAANAENAANSEDTDGGKDEESDDDDGKVSVSGEGDGDGKIKIETDDGTFEGGSGSELPDGFPEDFPLPDDAEVQFSGSQSGEGSSAMTVGIESKESGEDLYEFYVEELEDQGYEVTQSFSGESDGDFAGSLGFSNSEYEGVVSIGEDSEGDRSAITVSLTEK